VRYGVLGQVEVEVGTGICRPPSGSQRRLLAALLVDAGHAVTVDRLVDAVWGEDLPADGPGALRTQVMRLRRLLGPAAGDLRTEAGRYRLDLGPDDLDAGRFLALLDQAREAAAAGEGVALLDRALALWRGPAYADVVELDAVRPEAARLDELHITARQRRASLLLQVGRPEDAVADLTRLLAEDPEREAVRAELMRARYACGQHTEALALYDQWRLMLADQRGLDPGPELSELHQEVLRHTVRLPRQGSWDAAPVSRAAVAATVPPEARAPSNRFVGRDHDLQVLAGLLDSTPLVTLTGPGGVGKTRLALELGERAAPMHHDGVRFCDLSVLDRPEDVVRAVAASLGVEERAGAALLDQVVEHLRGHDLLLTVDNCEHLLDAAATVVEDIMRGAPGVRVLATSRERLAVAGEHVWELGPLPCAAADDPAVQLFLARAQAGEDDLGRVRELCARLDGLPLAIELAAGQARRWGVTGLLGALDRRLDVIGGSRRDAGRHRSLRAVVDWSYAQLGTDEQRVFDRLSVFAGPFCMDAAEAVVAEGVQAPVPAVLSLLERSMVSTAHTRDGRLVLLEHLRVYGAERLRMRGELDLARDAHARWVLRAAEERARQLNGSGEAAAAESLRSLVAEFRTAHAWLCEHDVAAALRLTDALHAWAMWRNISEVFRWAEAAARAGGRRPAAAGAWASAAIGACQRGDLPAAAAAAAAAAELDPGSPATDEATGEVALMTGDLQRAHRTFVRAYHRRVEEGDELQAVWDLGSAALALAYDADPEGALDLASCAARLADRSGGSTARAFAEFVLGEVRAPVDVDAAEGHLRRAVTLAGVSGARMVAGLARVTAATLTAHHRSPEEALHAYADVVQGWMTSGTWTAEWVTLRTLVDLLERTGVPADAALLHGATTASAVSVPPFGEDARLLADVEQRLRTSLGDEAFVRWSGRGAQCGPEEAAALALAALGRAQALTRR
jgi:predicted ATPase/DNA-binding SARP family transcriptional activator